MRLTHASSELPLSTMAQPDDVHRVKKHLPPFGLDTEHRYNLLRTNAARPEERSLHSPPDSRQDYRESPGITGNPAGVHLDSQSRSNTANFSNSLPIS